MTMRQAAADELAVRLKKAADELAGTGLRPRRVPFGRGHAGGLIKPRSPRGFVLDAVAPQLLLPDGRLWYYHSRLRADGIYFDARVDHERSEHGSIPVDDERFSFLGAVVHSYNFGYKHGDGDDPSGGFELGALIGKGGSAQFVDAAEAFAEIVASHRVGAKS
jgi:hypothetical protein